MRRILPILASTAFVLLLCASPAFAQGAASPPAAWKVFRYPELHLMFRAPATATPQVIDKMTSSGSEMVPEHQVVVVDGGSWAWMISVGDLTSAKGAMNIDGVPPGAAAGIKATIIGPVRTISIPGAEQGREYDAASDTVVVRSRVLIRARRLYQALAIKVGTTLAPDTDAFLTSVTPLP